jgi:hypothetical protein
MAEAQRFELWDLLQSAVFKTAALNHSATLPQVLRAAIVPDRNTLSNTVPWQLADLCYDPFILAAGPIFTGALPCKIVNIP